MKKNDFKKLALLGVTGGLLFSAPAEANQVDVNQETQMNHFMAAHGCGGHAGGRRRRPKFFPTPEEQSTTSDSQKNEFTGNAVLRPVDSK